MKNGTTDLLKFKRLQRRLKESTRGLVGLLEMLWMGTAKNCPRGNIGRFSNEDIAVLCEWDGDHDELVAALVECRWLDVHSEYRLVVHDWATHCPNWVKGNARHHGGLIGELTAPEQPRATPKDEPRDNPKDEPQDNPSSHPSRVQILPSQAKPSLVQSSLAKSSQAKSRSVPDRETAIAFGATLDLSIEDAEAFLNHYTANGWVQGRGKPIKDWQAAMRNWKLRKGEFGSGAGPPGTGIVRMSKAQLFKAQTGW